MFARTKTLHSLFGSVEEIGGHSLNLIDDFFIRGKYMVSPEPSYIDNALYKRSPSVSMQSGLISRVHTNIDVYITNMVKLECMVRLLTVILYSSTIIFSFNIDIKTFIYDYYIQIHPTI